MAIIALPQSTVRAVRSAPVLSDSSSVVKELIDNALDSGATSISVEVSANTLDIIQVKDNGCGIHPDDRPLVCKRSYTSKLQTIEDLKNIGGKSLGFRGEALASAAEMCGGLAVTTRVAGELAGEILKYDRQGLLLSNMKASHPIGTTVRVHEFLKFVPVRKQTALKCVPKSINRMKKMLNAYALSRPEIRLSFKVLKGKNESTWVYSAKRNATISDALLTVVGAEVALQCTTTTWPPVGGCEPVDGDENDSTQFRLIATLPRADSDLSKTCHTGQYVSIDKRTMSTSHGVAKQLVKLFKSYIRSVPGPDSNRSIVDPFIFLDIQCPTGSYDANVEPSKDNVIFEDSKTVLSLAEDMFKHVYGELRQTDALPIGDQLEPPSAPSRSMRGSNGAQPTRSNMAGGRGERCLQFSPDEDPVEILAPSELKDYPFTTPSHRDADNASSVSLSVNASIHSRQRGTISHHEGRPMMNPWQLAKSQCITPQKEKLSSKPNPQLLTPGGENEYRQPNNISLRNGRQYPFEVGKQPYPSPVSTQLSHAQSPIPRKPPRSIRKPWSSGPFQKNQSSCHQVPGQNSREQPGGGNLDEWINNLRGSHAHPLGDKFHIDSTQEDQDELAEIAVAERFGREPCRFGSTPPPETSPSRPPTGGLNVRFSGTENFPMNSSNGFKEGSGPLDNNQLNRRTHGLTEDMLVSPDLDRDVAEAMDFEHRKKAAKLLQKQALQREFEYETTFPPENGVREIQAPLIFSYQNRNTHEEIEPSAQSQGPHSHTQEQSMSPPTLAVRDSRAYLVRQNTSANPRGSRTRRVLTDHLPLETIPDACALHTLALTWHERVDKILALMNGLSEIDDYLQTGIILRSLSLNEGQTAETLNIWTSRLLALIREKYRSQNSEIGATVQLNLDAILASHVTAI
ncbi:hypothetical protein FQN50_003990 [Emmonsiellopsis sp. PD_5]|nr:hypothetical protein FQN50_003990 [Emmonsiellopsis sp. PD_5]